MYAATWLLMIVAIPEPCAAAISPPPTAPAIGLKLSKLVAVIDTPRIERRVGDSAGLGPRVDGIGGALGQRIHVRPRR